MPPPFEPDVGPRPPHVPSRAIVLSGGGARGAYEAGVLTYIFQELPHDLLAAAPIDVICGTSIGALHACFLAGNAQDPRKEIYRVGNLWRSFRIEEMLRLSLSDLLRVPGDVRALLRREPANRGMLVNTRLIHRIVTRELPWDGIRRNLRQGNLRALTVSATHIASGRTMVFVDTVDAELPHWTRDTRRLARKVRIAPKHALASAAMPLLFPAIRIDGAYYCDGGLRQNTPLSPALRLGADRTLVVGVSHQSPHRAPIPRHTDPQAGEAYPSAWLLMGKILDALMLDHLDYDLARLEGLNQLMADGEREFGEDFEAHISQSSLKMRGVSYRPVDTVVIRPSRDLGEIAMDAMASRQTELGKMSSWFLRRMTESDLFANADLLSYLLFDHSFAEPLIQLGMADAAAQRQQLVDFFKN